MKISENDFVFLKPTSTLLKKYRKIAPNLPEKSTRPMFCVVANTQEDKYWVIPVTSSNIEKFKERSKKSPDRFHFYNVKERENCFNISAMFPVRKEDIKNIYISQNKKVRIKQEDAVKLKNHIKSLLERPEKLYAVSNIKLKELEKEYNKSIEKNKTKEMTL